MADRATELWRQYIDRFGKNLAVPFGHWRSETWSEEDAIREYEIALETGIPFEPGTERWTETFGEVEPLPEGTVI